MSDWLKEFMGLFAHIDTRIVNGVDRGSDGVEVWFRATDDTGVRPGVERSTIEFIMGKIKPEDYPCQYWWITENYSNVC